jgi:hypothetical protein
MSDEKTGTERGALADNRDMAVGKLSNRTGTTRVQLKSAANGSLGMVYLRQLPESKGGDKWLVDVPERGFCPVIKVAQLPIPEIDDGSPEAYVWVGDSLEKPRRPPPGGRPDGSRG